MATRCSLEISNLISHGSHEILKSYEVKPLRFRIIFLRTPKRPPTKKIIKKNYNILNVYGLHWLNAILPKFGGEVKLPSILNI